jgi:hypothetical protein
VTKAKRPPETEEGADVEQIEQPDDAGWSGGGWGRGGGGGRGRGGGGWGRGGGGGRGRGGGGWGRGGGGGGGGRRMRVRQRVSIDPETAKQDE